MNDEQPIKIISTTVTGDHFKEALKASHVNSVFRYIPTRDAIRWFIVSLGALLIIWFTANQIAWWAWIFIPVLLAFILITGVMVYEVALFIKLQNDIKRHAKFLGSGRYLEFKIYQNYFHFKFDEEVWIEKWQDLHAVNIEISTITFKGLSTGDFYFLQPSFSPEEFDYLRKLFQEKLT